MSTRRKHAIGALKRALEGTGRVAGSLWKWITDPYRPVRQRLTTAVLIVTLVSFVYRPSICINVFQDSICFPIIIERAIDARDELRQCTNVTPMQGVSNEWSIENLADGVYGYAKPAQVQNIDSAPGGIKLIAPIHSTVEGRIEIHKASSPRVTGVFIVGHVTEIDLARLSDPERDVNRDIEFYLYPNEQTRLVAIGVNHISIRSHPRSVSLTYGRAKLVPVLDMSVAPHAVLLHAEAPECSYRD